MPIVEVPCPVCGSTCSIGIPRGSTIVGVDETEETVPSEEGAVCHRATCSNGDEFFFAFER